MVIAAGSNRYAGSDAELHARELNKLSEYKKNESLDPSRVFERKQGV